ncbi:hypothetical protein HRW07_10050 [Streptomyces lunaelactis]|uniref:hypothetical protein n=1 Tax=Streptomyces lunaelactis TaxID=1535768 RepID=UPI001584B571|nr:hypothetical protein [Streptomyces lunaelactis]NUL03570.1 hypothetical protein [Streptomyces lunaelactis]
MTADEALARLAEARENADGPLAEIFDIIAAEVERTGNPAAVAARVQYLTGTGPWA